MAKVNGKCEPDLMDVDAFNRDRRDRIKDDELRLADIEVRNMDP